MSVWAKRKAAVQAEAEVLERSHQEAVIAEQHTALAQKSEEEVLAELDLPNPDEMQSGDDFSAFMKSSVPSALRNRALRKLWVSDPVLANVDSLVDYGEDFTGKNDVARLVKTIYRVGKGMLPDDEDVVEPEAASVEPQIEDVSEEITLADEDIEMAVVPEIEAAGIDANIPAPLPRRRMRFSFADGTSPMNSELEIQ